MAAVIDRIDIISARSWVPDAIEQKIRQWSPKSHLGQYVRDVIAHHLPPEITAELIEMFARTVVIESSLSGVVLLGNGRLEPVGLMSQKLVTTAGVGFIVDAFQNTTELENMKYHALGTGSTAEASGDTALETELTTEYTGNVRATGTTEEGASANIFKTVATNTLDGTPGAALREHGVMSQAATGGGVLLDRSVYSAITLSSGDGLQTTYELTCSAGG